MTLPMLFSFLWSRVRPLPRQRSQHPEKDFMEISILQAHDQRVRQSLWDERDIAVFEARMQSLLSERNWW